MRIPLILFTLGLLSFNAWAVEPPSTVPFAKRYDPASITTASRAREVIAAYDNEKRVWENWYKEETAQCYRNFFVTYCLDKAKSERTEHINEARRVWMLSPLAVLKLLPRHETSRLASRAKAMPQIAF